MRTVLSILSETTTPVRTFLRARSIALDSSLTLLRPPARPRPLLPPQHRIASRRAPLPPSRRAACPADLRGPALRASAGARRRRRERDPLRARPPDAARGAPSAAAR